MPYKPQEKSVLVNLGNTALILHLPGRVFKISHNCYIDLDLFPDAKKKMFQINEILVPFERSKKVLFLNNTNKASRFISTSVSITKNKVLREENFDEKLNEMLNTDTEKTRVDKVVEFLDGL